MQRIGDLFRQIELLGLTKKEVDISKTVLLRPLRVPGLSSSALRQNIEQKQASAAVPPAAPVAPAAPTTETPPKTAAAPARTDKNTGQE